MGDRIGFGLGRTINLGNFESLRLDVSMYTEVAEGENKKTAFKRCKIFVERRLEEECRDYESQLKPGKGGK